MCASVYVWLILHHMLGDRVRIGEEKRKINYLRNECIAAFTHCRGQAKYSSSSLSQCSAPLQARGLRRATCRPGAPQLFKNSRKPCFVMVSNERHFFFSCPFHLASSLSAQAFDKQAKFKRSSHGSLAYVSTRASSMKCMSIPRTLLSVLVFPSQRSLTPEEPCQLA